LIKNAETENHQVIESHRIESNKFNKVFEIIFVKIGCLFYQ